MKRNFLIHGYFLYLYFYFSTAEQFIPLVKKTVGYIVCGIIFDDCGRILMMQEAKSSCFGTWYVPAGRMETGENLLVSRFHYHTFHQ